MRWMAPILLVVAIGGGIGWGIATVTTTGDPSTLDYARRLDRNRFVGGFAGLGCGFIACVIIAARRAGGTGNDGLSLGD